MEKALRQKNIPKDWSLVKLSDLLDYEQPSNYIVENAKYSDSAKIPVLTANKSFVLGCTDEDSGIYEDVPVIIFDDFTTDSKYVDFPFKIKSSAIKILKNKDPETDLRFVYEKMKSIKFPVGNHKRHYISQYQNLDILLPSEIEQKRISEILGTVDEGIKKMDEIIHMTNELKNGLMQKFFNKEKLNEKIGDHTIHVGSGSTPRGGSKVYEKEGIPFIRSQNVYFSGLVTDDLVFINNTTHDQMSRSKVSPGDVLLNITGASIGRACIAPDNLIEANVNQHVCIIRTNKDLESDYLFYFLQSEEGQRQISKFQTGGNRQGLNFQQIRSMKFPLPRSKEVQLETIEALSLIDEKISINQKLKEKLTLLKKGLAQDLLSGEKRTI